MSSAPTSRAPSPCHPSRVGATVARLVDTHLAPATHPGAADDPSVPHLIGAVLAHDGLELLARPLAGHPADELLGFTAPADWVAIGISSGGWASWYDPLTPDVPRATGIDRRRVRVVYVLDRAGDAHQIVHDRDEPPHEHRFPVTAPDAGGHLDDCCRRSFGLPTAPPPTATLDWFTTSWVDQVFAGAAEGRLVRAGWAEVAALHPAVQRAQQAGDPALVAWATEHLVRAGALLAEAQPWARLHQAAGRAPARPGGLDPAIARWMDTGMFARTLLASVPPIDQLLLDSNGLIEPAAHQRLLATIDAWGVLTARLGTDAPSADTPTDPTRDCSP